MNPFQRFTEHHHWFIQESAKYLGWDSYYRARWKQRWPFYRAWCRFMWLSRRSILKGDS